MADSAWIDGSFRGGRFKGLTNSYLITSGVDYGKDKSFHTGVIQKFRFFDQNVSGIPFKFKYNSWIDVNYYVTEGVNLNKYNQVYTTTPLGFTSAFYENNHYIL